LKTAVTVPCQVVRPEKMMPNLKDKFIALSSLVVESPFIYEKCCGATLMITNENLCLDVLNENLDKLKEWELN